MRTVHLKEVKAIIAELKRRLKPLEFQAELKGGLRERGSTSHDVDLAITLPTLCLSEENEIFNIINKYGNILYDKFKLELDVDFFFKGKFVYKLDQHGFVEV